MRILSVPGPLNDNPYQRLLYDAVEAAGGTLLEPGGLSGRNLRASDGPGRVLHVHWLWLKGPRPRRFLRSRRYVRLLKQAGELGWKRIWTAHNVHAHEGTEEDRWLSRQLSSNVDGVIVHSREAEDVVRKTYGLRCPVEVIPHGHYRDAYPKAGSISRDDARARIGMTSERPMLLAFGQIRPYKGFVDLVERFATSDLDATLVIAGRPMDPATAATLESAAASDERIVTDLRFHDPDATALLFAASDRVVLPYRRVTTSGTLALALSLERPVVIPDESSLIEACEENAASVYTDLDDMIPAIRRALDTDREVGELAAARSADALAWGPIGERTVAFMRSL